MAGIYIHIPFCMQKCGYCDFYSLVSLQDKSDFVVALCTEISLRFNELNHEELSTLYFGGGTPSVLKKKDFEQIFTTLNHTFDLSGIEEFTVEVNPDDINPNYLNQLKELGFNRLSMGIQSFNDRILNFMNRRHNAQQAWEAVQMAKNAGFDNISIDLIYGIPGMSIPEWNDSIDKAIALNIQHISAYHLTFEPGTVFYKKLKQNIINEVTDLISVKQYEILIDKLTSAGFDDYEISNFSLPGLKSKHNSSYWNSNIYLGFGPSAHSYSKYSRRWNISDLKKYMHHLNHDGVIHEEEILTETDIYNEKIMLGLRIKEGLEMGDILNMNPKITQVFNEKMSNNIHLKNVYIQSGRLKVFKEKKILTDQIISDFFIV